MDLVVGALHVILPKLAKLLGDEYKLQSAVKEGIEYLDREFRSMQVALKKVSEVPADQLDPQVKLWVRNLRDMSYHIQDTVDAYMVHVDAAGESVSCTTCCVNVEGILPRTSKARHNIAIEIERIKKEVEEVSSRRERYKVDGMAVPAPSDPRLVGLYQDKEKLVGINRSSEEIIKLMYTSEQKLKLVSIVGPGGMGKTTLANVAYQKLEDKFICTAFVSVSLQPNMKNILGGILRQVTSKLYDDQEDKDKHKDKSLQRRESQKHYGNTDSWSEKELIDKIRHVLEKRRYLILIDDIWDEQSWKHIECVLFENKLGSKVITTTRNVSVANSCCSSEKVDGTIHELQPLSNGDSEELFYYKIFGEDSCPTELKNTSQKILKKCEGWPLAIVTIASVLANKRTETEWSSVYNSISTGLGYNQGVKDMRSILSLSYHDMPSQLRACFLYLSIFPEDHIIGRDDLIRRWIAEDLIHGAQDDNLYELGDKYFTDLINRSMLQPSDVGAFGRAHACKIHDLVLEFITFLSAEEGFFTILNGKQHFPSQRDSIHRLSLQNSKGEHGVPQATKKLPHVRTLVVSSRAINSMPPLSIFLVLRVLELEHCTSRNIESMGNLVHLRYLRLSQQFYGYLYEGRCIKLPKEIGNLQLLQTLNLKEAWIEEFPSTVIQLRQLRLLEISLHKWDERRQKSFLQSLCNLKQLEALCIFAPEDLSLDFMLQVDWAPSHLQRFAACPRENQHILRRGYIWAESSPFSALPRWISSSLSGLSDLSIMVRTLQQAELEILADLPILRSFDLEVVESTGTRLEINGCVGTSTGHATTFCSLGSLKFASRAVGLVFGPGAMQKLQKLYLFFDLAETLDVHGDLDLGFENLSSVETVNVEIDCRCARLSEVKAAEAALRNATSLNPKCITLDLKWHWEGEMLRDEEEEIPEEMRAKKKEDALLSRVGPFGGNGGRARDIRVAPHRLVNVIICSSEGIESIEFSYTDQNGQQRTAGPWGGRGGRVSTATINFGPSEYLIAVSGTNGSFRGLTNLVTSLTLVTNAASYGPFGEGGGDPFVLPAQSNNSIVGFFGRAGWYLDAIGFYVRRL